ncbi:PfkB family carbohydrate kinase [Poseidonibacter lekithochrous]|uniref:PfkB family carbohydrate kinase n=1 Tax=Poseidonibacter lekithochrous TaxID=1904463 RepID=UPI0008FCBA70|nr:PfkB family carbohydrate kinase [Poseidonibacter lekithochrous]QKJ22274.1 sugar kinase [Poseidonibacter lekithochrous]
MKKIILCGSLAYDNIIVSNDTFIEQYEKYNSLNMSLSTGSVRVEYGGCAGNIAYGLNQLGIKSKIISSLGKKDSKNYLKHLKSNNIKTNDIRIFKGFSAQAHILNDKENNQITSFYLGSLSNRLNDVTFSKNNIVMISPDNIENMKFYANYCIKNNIEFIFDPGQVISMFNKKDLKLFISKSKILIINQHEFNFLASKFNEKKLFNLTKKIIITKDSSGSELYINGEMKHYEKANTVIKKEIIDPTGCGDAYRAGVLYSLIIDDIKKGMKIGSNLASENIKSHGTQNYKIKG